MMAAFVALVVSISANAQNCAGSVDKICDAFDSMTSQMAQCSTREGVDLLNIDIVIEESGVADISGDCLNYVLTNADKEKLNAAFDKFMTVSADKTFELCRGTITKTQIARELEPLRKSWKEGLAGATTLGDLAEVMQDI